MERQAHPVTGVAGIQEWDKTVNDYTDPGKKKPKNPDTIGPPISYMKECGVFQPLPSTMNPLGLCHFYPTDPSSLSTLVPPKLPATMDHLNNLLVLAKSRQWLYIIVVFEGGPVMPLGLLQELHSCHTLAHIPIFLPEETKDGHKPQILCCPFCAYTIQNDPGIPQPYHQCPLPHELRVWEMSGHRNNIGPTNEKAHFRVPQTACSSREIVAGKCAHDEHSPKKHAHGSSGSKSKDGGSKSKQKHKSEKLQLSKPASQEDSQTSDRHLTCICLTCESGEHHWILAVPLQWEEESEEGAQEEEEVWQVISHASI